MTGINSPSHGTMYIYEVTDFGLGSYEGLDDVIFDS